MSKYKKARNDNTGVLGMLYIVEVNLSKNNGLQRVKQKLLLVGCEEADIERKINWIIDRTKYDGFSIKNIEKVREKVHVLSTTYKESASIDTPTILRGGSSQPVPQGATTKKYDPKLYAVGLITTMLGEDEDHAIRKVGNALIASTVELKSKSAKGLSEDSTLTIEEIPLSSGYSKGKNYDNEINKATFVRG